jgi:hypothetical protein
MQSIKPRAKPIEQLDVKQLVIKDAEIVRYRVYSDPDNFLAVIAESALMAMKKAEIDAPYKVVRDLISQASTLEEDSFDQEKERSHAMAMTSAIAEKKNVAMEQIMKSGGVDFTPLSLEGVSQRVSENGSIIGVDAMLAIIEAQAKAKAAQEKESASKAETEAKNTSVTLAEESAITSDEASDSAIKEEVSDAQTSPQEDAVTKEVGQENVSDSDDLADTTAITNEDAESAQDVSVEAKPAENPVESGDKKAADVSTKGEPDAALSPKQVVGLLSENEPDA